MTTTNPTPHAENRETFFKRLRPILAPSELLNVEVAYALAKHAHRSQTRKELDEDGNPIRYFEHLRRTALILIDELEIHEPEMVISALMHDSIEDTKDIDDRMLEHLFGSEVSRIVKLLSKDPKEGYYDRLMKYGNQKVWIIKGCDRLDNLRSLKDTTPEFQKKQLAETREKIYPVLNRACQEERYVFQAKKLRETIHNFVDNF